MSEARGEEDLAQHTAAGAPSERVILATVGHEVRNAALALVGSLERVSADLNDVRAALANPEMLDVCTQLLEAATHKTQRLTTEVQQLAAFVQQAVDSAVQEVPRQRCPVSRLIAEAVDSLIRLFLNRSLDIRVDPAAGTCDVFANPEDMRAVFVNVIKNAAESMPTGGQVQVSACARSDGVQVQVMDEGVGIPPGLHDRVFEPYFTTRSAEGGMGLGLAICRHILAEHGGTIRVDARPTRGTVVTINLPTVPSESRPEPHGGPQEGTRP